MVDLSPSDHLFNLALKSPMTVVRKGLLLNESSRLISKYKEAQRSVIITISINFLYDWFLYESNIGI